METPETDNQRDDEPTGAEGAAEQIENDPAQEPDEDQLKDIKGG